MATKQDAVSSADKPIAGEVVWRLLLAAFVVLLFFGITARASMKVLTNDELLTRYVALQGSIGDIWSVLIAGSDGNPPLGYLLVRATLLVFGDHALALRLPAIAGFLMFTVCLYIFVSKRTSRAGGLIAALVPCFTSAYSLAYDARPYGPILGCAGLMLVFWQQSIDNQRRPLALLGFAAAYAAAIWLHYYSVLLVMPFAAAEAVRAIQRRKLDWAFVGAAALGAAALLPLIPLVKALSKFSGSFWGKPGIYSIPAFYEHLLAPAIVPSVFCVILAAVMMSSRQWLTPSGRAEKENLPETRFSEIALALAFLFYPVLIGVLAFSITNAFHNKYPIPATIGFAIMVPFLLSELGRSVDSRKFLIVFIPCFAWFMATQTRAVIGLVVHPPNRFSDLQLPLVELPVVINDDHTFLALSHYGPADLISRMYYIADPGHSLRITGSDTGDRTLSILNGYRVSSYSGFLANNQRFLVYSDQGWVLTKLLEDGYHIQVLGKWVTGNRISGAPEQLPLFLIQK